jgi:fumarate reductase flavoprotein subunit
MLKKTPLLVTTSLFLLFACSFITEANETNLKTDVVVIGGGGAGLAAAVSVAEGGKDVIVLEKMPVLGGATNFAEGIFAVDSVLQRKENINLTTDQVFKQHMEYSHWLPDPRLVRTIIDKSSDTIDWLMEHGVKISGLGYAFPGAPRTWHTFDGYGAAIIQSLHKTLKEKNARILLRTPAKSLIKKGGRIAGVIAEDKDGNKVKVKAGAVIIASGGFAANEDMLKTYTKAGPNMITFGSAGKTGDGIKMAWDKGAASEGVDLLQLAIPIVPGERGITPLIAVLSQPYLWVNQKGERFFEEGTFPFPFMGNAIAKQPEQLMYLIFDENTKKYMMEEGIDVGAGIYVPTGTKLKDLDIELNRGIDKGEVFVADSLKELAKAIDMDRDIFLATVEEYNRFCAKKHDDLFAKNPKYLQAVSSSKYYAIRGHIMLVGTLGGIRINYKTEVLNKNSEPIPGIYAAGNCAGGMYGETYDESFTTGLTLGFAINSGRIAGENAIAYVNKK